MKLPAFQLDYINGIFSNIYAKFCRIAFTIDWFKFKKNIKNLNLYFVNS